MTTERRFSFLPKSLYIADKLKTGGWIGKQGREPTDFAFCMTTLLVALRWDGNIRLISEAMPYDMDRVRLPDLRDTIANLGYESKSHDVDLRAIDPRLLPCLFVPKGHDGDKKAAMVVLDHTQKTKASDETIHVFDGKKREIVTYPADVKMEGTAYFFHQLDEEEEEHIAQTRSWFTVVAERFGRLFTFIFLASFMISMLALIPPLYIMLVYDKVIGPQTTSSLPYFFVGVSLFAIIEFWLRGLRTKMVSWFGSRLDFLVGIAVFEHLSFLPAAYTEKASVSSQVARIKAFDMVRDFFTGPLFLVFLELPFLLVTLTAISFISGKLVLIPLTGMLIFFLAILFLLPRFHLVVGNSSTKSAHRQELIIETYAKIRLLKTSYAYEEWFKRFRKTSGESSLSTFKSALFASGIESLAQMISAGAAVVLVYFGVKAIWAGDITVGALVATMILIWRTLTPVQNVCGAITSVEQVFSSISQINRLMVLKCERNPHISPNPVKYLEGNIEFSHVGIRYSKDIDPVFSSLDLKIKAGETTAIIGKHGAGKTTILKLLNGLYHPQVGGITIDFMDIRQLDPIELRQHVAYLPQKPDFFRGSIADNLRIIDPFASEDELKKALVKADAWKEVQELPDGLNTVIGEEEAQHFSTHFIYQLGIARVYLSNSNIMLLDEIPSAILKSKAGKELNKFIKSQKGKRTILVVTHSPDFMALSDKIIVLKKGELPQVTTFDQVQQAVSNRKGK